MLTSFRPQASSQAPKVPPEASKVPSVWEARCFAADSHDFVAVFGRDGAAGTYHAWVVGIFGPKLARDFKLALRVGRVGNG